MIYCKLLMLHSSPALHYFLHSQPWTIEVSLGRELTLILALFIPIRGLIQAAQHLLKLLQALGPRMNTTHGSASALEDI